MDTILGNTNFRYSHRRSDGYEALKPTGDHNRRKRVGVDHDSSDDYDGHGDRRPVSKPRSSTSLRQHPPAVMLSSFSYRRNRARQRQIFLQTYKLSSVTNNNNNSSRKSHPKLKKFVVKVKSMVVSVLSFMRADYLRSSCKSGSAICVTSPSGIVKLC
ncbi:OLC1v1024034C1 [Oldenlandia corymbosa var. corymbosa]|uniref:OLC1v1024034C1 n=1 Tax=Oldenlandia corymbosa var. corymbosa TaxID=529605 RepID=A0AAV1C3Q9_OLDCO|nr:OLC1v1024034C1 [Oldenlandia corymbosa var. corymbosa]